MTQAALNQFTQRVRNIYGDAQNCEQIASEILNYCGTFCDNTRRKVLEEVELTLGTHAIADQLRELGLPKTALMSTWTEHMTGRFEQPEEL